MNPGSELQLLLNRLAGSKVPGISVAVGAGGRLLWQGAAGYSDLRTAELATPDLAVGIGSITKTLIAVIVLQLAEEEFFSLDEPIGMRLPSRFVENIGNAQQTTISELLSHHGGIRSWEDHPEWIRRGRGCELLPGKIWNVAEPLDYIRGLPSLCDPGEEFHYSNTGFTLLGLLIEQATGRCLYDVMQQRILQPLALRSMYLEGYSSAGGSAVAGRYHWRTAQFEGRAGVSPHFRSIGPDLIDVSISNLSVEWAAGGVVSTASDLLHFMMALRDGRLLSPISVEHMRRWRSAGERGYSGKGLFYFRTLLGHVLGHDGNVLGSSASAWWFESSDCTVAILVNVGSMHAGPRAINAGALFRSTDIARLALRICDEDRMSAR